MSLNDSSAAVAPSLRQKIQQRLAAGTLNLLPDGDAPSIGGVLSSRKNISGPLSNHQKNIAAKYVTAVVNQL